MQGCHDLPSEINLSGFAQVLAPHHHTLTELSADRCRGESGKDGDPEAWPCTAEHPSPLSVCICGYGDREILGDKKQ